MSDSEAVEVVHQMMAAREQEMAAAQVYQPKHKPSARRQFGKEVAGCLLGLAYAVMFALLMAVLQ